MDAGVDIGGRSSVCRAAVTCVLECWFFLYFPEDCQNLAGGYLFRNISLVGQ